MFLNELTDAQKNSFLALATRMVLADGKVQPEESAFLEAMKSEMGGTVTAPPEEVFGAVNPEPFAGNARAQTVALLELMVMGYADADFHAEENKIVEEVRDTFQIAPETFEHLKDLAKQEAVLIVEALSMIGKPIET